MIYDDMTKCDDNDMTLSAVAFFLLVSFDCRSLCLLYEVFHFEKINFLLYVQTAVAAAALDWKSSLAFVNSLPTQEFYKKKIRQGYIGIVSVCLINDKVIELIKLCCL